jgi:hypothetical protein
VPPRAGPPRLGSRRAGPGRRRAAGLGGGLLRPVVRLVGRLRPVLDQVDQRQPGPGGGPLPRVTVLLLVRGVRLDQRPALVGTAGQCHRHAEPAPGHRGLTFAARGREQVDGPAPHRGRAVLVVGAPPLTAQQHRPPGRSSQHRGITLAGGVHVLARAEPGVVHGEHFVGRFVAVLQLVLLGQVEEGVGVRVGGDLDRLGRRRGRQRLGHRTAAGRR